MPPRTSYEDADPSKPLIAPADVQTALASAHAYEALGVRQQVQAEAAAAAEAEASNKQQQATTSKVVATVTATAVAGYLFWLVQGGSLLLSAITAMPFWRWFDPLPVLESWDKALRRGKRARRNKNVKGSDEESELEGIID